MDTGNITERMFERRNQSHFLRLILKNASAKESAIAAKNKI